MKSNLRKWVSGILIMAAGLALFAGCAEERDPIDRVQPYALPKTFFIGEDFNSADDDPEFWSQNTMVDVGYGAAQSGLFTSTYAQPMSRLKWQITEDYLIARAAYERINFSDGKGKATGLETQDGVIVAVFPITKHFDIVNAYNPTTGEKLNVVEENAFDRPWYEREYVRVDWSRNLNTDSYDFDTLSLLGVYGSLVYEPLSYYVEDPNHEDAPYFDLENGYFDVTTKAFAKPGLVDLSHLGWSIKSFPACYLDRDFFGGTYPAGSCSPVELTLRHSFRRVVDNDFQPVEWDGWRFQAYGGFAWTERMGYARDYGMTDELHHRFLSRFQIWERAHYYDNPEEMTGHVSCYTPDTIENFGDDPNADEDGNGTADACEVVTDHTGFGGSQCDTFTQKCTLPFRARTPKPLAWYYTTGSDQRYFDPTEEATHQWDVGLRGAIRAAKYSECVAVDCVAGAVDPEDTTAVDECRNECRRSHPMYFGQQDDNDDAVRLAREMDNCRKGKAYADLNGDESACASMVDRLVQTLGTQYGVGSIAKMPETIVLCHSPVEAGDPEVCAPEEERLPEGVTAEDCSTAREEGNAELLEDCLAARNVRRGDLRYHLANVIEEPATPSPWGIMTSAVDPVNGQTIQSCVNVWSWVNSYWAQRLVDYMRYAAGELTDEEVTEAEYIKNWSQAIEAAERGSAVPVTRQEFDKRMAGFFNKSLTDSPGPGSTTASNTTALKNKDQLNVTPQLMNKLRQVRDGFGGVLADSQKASTTTPLYQARFGALKGSEIEAELMNEKMQQLYGVDEMYMTDGLMDMVSPIRGGNLSLRREMERMKENALAERGMCELEMSAAPVAINGLSKILQEKFSPFSAEDPPEVQRERQDKMVDYIARKAHMAVITHEMGHAMAHRHNFVSSSDAYNYRPQYWQLRTNNGEALIGEATPLADLQDPTGESTLGPRYFDPVSQNEEDNLIWMWSASSVMDYAGEATQDFLGMGAWDFAALRMFYGDSVPVYPKSYANPSPDASIKPRQRAEGIMQKLDNFGGILGFSYGLGPNGPDLHYSRLASENYGYHLIQDCYDVDVNAYKPGHWNDTKDGTWHPVLDGEIVSIDGGQTYSRCRQPTVDYIPWRTMRPPTFEEAPKYDENNVAYLRATGGYTLDYGSVVDPLGRVRVPYGFATDRWADIGNAAVYRHDNGADTYEIFGFFIAQQELFHIFDNYRRGRMTFTVSGASGRLNGRYNGKIRDGAKGLALQRNFLNQLGMDLGYHADGLWETAASSWYPESVMASTLVFDHFTKMAQRPEVGPHTRPTWGSIEGDVLVSQEDSGFDDVVDFPTLLNVPNGAFGTDGGFESFSSGGKLVENRLDESKGEYEANYTVNAGSYYDKIWASMMMTESVDNFISDSRGDFVDARYRATSLADLFPDGYRRWLGNALTNDEFIKGARVATDVDGVPLVDEDSLYPDVGIGYTNWWQDPPEVCFPIEGTNVCGAAGPNMDLGDDPAYTTPVESQLGWEVQKFLIAWTYCYLPENDQQWWIDQLWMYDITGNEDIVDLDNSIQFLNPDGRSYLARRFGKETIFGKTVEKGIAARALQYANELMYQAYETTPVDDDGDGTADWYEVVRNPATGEPVVLYDATLTLGGQGAGCTPSNNAGCTCGMNRYCQELERYVSVLRWLSWFSWQIEHSVNGWDDMTGIYG